MLNIISKKLTIIRGRKRDSQSGRLFVSRARRDGCYSVPQSYVSKLMTAPLVASGACTSFAGLIVTESWV